jgi:hypothetical protein
LALCGSFSPIDLGVPPNEVAMGRSTLLPAAILPRVRLSIEAAAQSLSMFGLPQAGLQPSTESAEPLRCEPVSSIVASAWEVSEVACQFPPTNTVAPRRSELSPATDVLPLKWSRVENFAPGFQILGAVMSASPQLLLSKPALISGFALPRYESPKPLGTEACRLPVSVSEREWVQSAAYLHPSVPSPLSLVTWSQSLAISIPACHPSNLNRSAPVAMSANPGHVDAFRAWPPSRRGYRITPLRPQPNREVWKPVAPMQAILLPPVVKPIRPGSAGTAPPNLIAVRSQPSSMPMLPSAESPYGTSYETRPAPGPAVLGPCSEDTLRLAYRNAGFDSFRLAWELHTESNAVLPHFSLERPVPVLDQALSSDRTWTDAIPPAQPLDAIQPFPNLKRLACSVTSARLALVEQR